MEYVLKGSPTPLARPRLGKGYVYDSQKNIKLIQGIELSRQHGDMELFDGPLHMDFIFRFRGKHRQLGRRRLLIHLILCGSI